MFKSNKNNYKFSKLAWYYIVITNVLCILMIYGLSNFVQEFSYNKISMIYGIMFCLACISVIALFVFYRIYKYDYIFIIAHFFLFVAIKYIYINHLYMFYKRNDFSIFMILEILFLSLDYIVLKFQNSKVSKIILNNRGKYFLGSLFIILANNVIENVIIINNKNQIFFKYIVIIEIIMFLNFAQLVINIYKKALKQKKTEFYLFIGISINIILIKQMYLIISIIQNKFNYIISLFLFIMSSVAIIIGFFDQIIHKIQEGEILRFKLDIFYKFVENNPNNNFVLLSKDNHILYANALVRNKYCNSKDKIEKQYEQLQNNSKFINHFSNSTMLEQMNKKGKCTGLINIYDDRHIKIEGQRIPQNDSYVDLYSYIDVTNVFRSNEKLRQSEEKLNAIFETTLDLILGVDIHGNILYINKSVANNLYYDSNKLIGQKVKQYVVKYDSELMNEFIKNSEMKNVMITNTILDGKHNEIPLESTIQKVNNKNGDVVGYTIVGRNISMRKKLDKITQKYKEIKEYEKIRTDFFANISHELRTPINIIYSCIQLLNEEKSNSDELLKYYNKYENSIKQNCFRILRLINNIIDIAKYNSEEVKLGFVNHDIVSLVEDITMSTVPFVEAKKLNITFDTSVEELVIKCNPENIERVMLNLISNAVKFTHEGGNISVILDVDSKYVYIRVKDTGIGIPVEFKDAIFKRFVQADKSLKRRKEGSGIGLALVKSIVKLHNGDVCVESTGKKGSVFLVKLPNVKLETGLNQESYICDNSICDNNKNEKTDIEFSDIYYN